MKVGSANVPWRKSGSGGAGLIGILKKRIMIKSMTGYGKGQKECGSRVYQVEVRSINSKTLDLNLKLPSEYREMEPLFRSRVAAVMQRGKVECSLSVQQAADAGMPVAYHINMAQVERYWDDFRKISENLVMKRWADDFPEPALILTLPGAVVEEKADVLDESSKESVLCALEQSLVQADASRQQEGAVLSRDFRMRVALIEDFLAQVEPFEQQRVPNIRQKMEKQLADLNLPVEIDRNRLEQEMIYYLEKLDITEEKVRLRKHCRYFMDTMEAEPAPGRKLGFIAQEMGREINTLGSKANEADIQKLVVRMKDELEKIKEQLANIL